MTFAENPAGTLYIVSTPIGNLADISLRAIEILKAVDLIASEDTRNSGRLLSKYDIKTRQISYHDHNEKSMAPKIVEQLKNGTSVALISDAGTPLISDPGYRLVNLAVEENVDIVPIPGASSILAALAVSGFPINSFCFEGYPPKTSGKLIRFFENLKDEHRTIVLFETPHRIKKCLTAMSDIVKDREIMIGRELTKKFEEKIRGDITTVLNKIDKTTIKGEFVIVICGKRKK